MYGSDGYVIGLSLMQCDAPTSLQEHNIINVPLMPMWNHPDFYGPSRNETRGSKPVAKPPVIARERTISLPYFHSLYLLC